MAKSEFAQAYMERMFPEIASPAGYIDPEFEDLFENLQDPHTVTVIEWADTVSEILPANHLRLEILINDDGSRTLNLTQNLTSEH